MEFILNHVDSPQRDVNLALCAAVLLIFILLLTLSFRGSRLRKRIDVLEHSLQQLVNAEQKRFLDELRDQPAARRPDSNGI